MIIDCEYCEGWGNTEDERTNYDDEEECPYCLGLGFIETDDEDSEFF